MWPQDFALLLPGDFYFSKTTGSSVVDGRSNLFQMEADARPLLVTQDDEGNLAAIKVLLIPDVAVGAEQNLVPCIFGLLNQFTVGEFVPTDLPSERDMVTGQTASDGFRRTVVEQDAHLSESRRSGEALGCEMENGLDFLGGHVEDFRDLTE